MKSFKKICVLGLPSGCLLMRYVLDEKQSVPRADTFLEDPMRATAVIAPEAEEGITMITNGTLLTNDPESGDTAGPEGVLSMRFPL
jgi:hypothetical protein